MGLPVITFRNSATMPQERYNATWVEENQLGRVIGSVNDLPGAVASVLSDLSSYKQHVQQINNQAVFEVVASLAHIMSKQVPKEAIKTS